MNTLEEEVCELCSSLLGAKPRIRMLEAGCGSASHVKFRPAVDAVGIDISPDQLERNKTMQEKILGDIQEYPLPRNEFDVVVCWWVMEHLSRPKDALVNMFGSVKPEGLLILAFPNLLSFKGLATKITPFWFHKLFYLSMGIKSGPFPTYLRLAILPENVMRFAEKCGFSVRFSRLGEGFMTRRIRTSSRLADLALSAVDLTMQTISFGKVGSLWLDYCVMILQKHQMIP